MDQAVPPALEQKVSLQGTPGVFSGMAGLKYLAIRLTLFLRILGNTAFFILASNFQETQISFGILIRYIYRKSSLIPKRFYFLKFNPRAILDNRLFDFFRLTKLTDH